MDDDPEPLESLMAQLAAGQREVRPQDLTVLSELGSPELITFTAGWHGIAPERRQWAVRKLADLAEHDVTLDFNSVFLACLDDSDAQVRTAAIKGLWEYEGYELALRLRQLLAIDPDLEVRAEAALALGRFVILAEFGSLSQDESEPVLRALRDAIANPDEIIMVRARALEAIGACSQPWVKGIIRKAYHDADPGLFLSAIHAMGRNCDSVWLPHLLQELESDDSLVRWQAAAACGTIGDEMAVVNLARLLDDDDADVQKAAIVALGQIDSLDAKAILLERLRQPTEGQQQLIEDALAAEDSINDSLAFRFPI